MVSSIQFYLGTTDRTQTKGNHNRSLVEKKPMNRSRMAFHRHHNLESQKGVIMGLMTIESSNPANEDHILFCPIPMFSGHNTKIGNLQNIDGATTVVGSQMSELCGKSVHWSHPTVPSWIDHNT